MFCISKLGMLVYFIVAILMEISIGLYWEAMDERKRTNH